MTMLPMDTLRARHVRQDTTHRLGPRSVSNVRLARPMTMGIQAQYAHPVPQASFLPLGRALVMQGRAIPEPVAKIAQQVSMTRTASPIRHVKTVRPGRSSLRLDTARVLTVLSVSIRTQMASSHAYRAAVADTELQLQRSPQARA